MFVEPAPALEELNSLQDEKSSIELKLKSLQVRLKEVKKRIQSTCNADINLDYLARNQKESKRRNSWADIYKRNTSIRQGNEIVMEKWFYWRNKWGQRGIPLFCFLGILCYTLTYVYENSSTNGMYVFMQGCTLGFSTIALMFICLFYYKNVSFIICKRLLYEPNVVMIIILTLFVLTIDFLKPHDVYSYPIAIVYVVCTIAFVFLDAIKVKTRCFVLVAGLVYLLLNMFIIYSHIFGNSGGHDVLFKYSIQNIEYTFMKRATKRSIFIQITLFSISGLWTLCKDTKMELLMFATGNIYRETGTVSKYIEDSRFAVKMKREGKNSAADYHASV